MSLGNQWHMVCVIVSDLYGGTHFQHTKRARGHDMPIGSK